MAKTEKNKGKKQSVETNNTPKKPVSIVSTPLKINPEIQKAGTNKAVKTNLSRFYPLIIGAVACILYINTLANNYCQDDSIVITENMFTTQGFGGFSGILNYDTFYGFFKEAGKDKLVAGGRYRPFSLLTFATEYQFFGANPFVGHLVNVVLFALTGVLLYKVLNKLFSEWSENNTLTKATEGAANVAFIAALLFVAHPVHTEAVANIKGRDEILALLLSLYAVWLTMRYVENKKNLYLVGAFFSFLGAVLSKENAITFVVLAPAMLYFFYKFSLRELIKPAIPFLAAAVIFLIMRSNAIGSQFGGEQNELMNNPFLVWSGTQYLPMPLTEKFATIVYTLGKYVQLLIFPEPLTHDYYPRHVAVMEFSDMSVSGAALLYLGLMAVVVLGWRRRSIWSFSAFFYLTTLFIVSNLIFPVGTNMAERFIFTPSVGFCIAAAFALYHYLFPKYRNIFFGILGIFVLGFGVKTISRNTAWRDNFTLFNTDVSVSENSAKLQCSVGGSMVDSAKNIADATTKCAMLMSAIPHLQRALQIHPQFSNPYLLQGNAYYYLNNLDSAIYMYRAAIKMNPNFKDARSNLALTLRDKGRILGQANQLQQSIEFLTESANLNPADAETFSSLGTAYGLSGAPQKSIESLQKALAIRNSATDLQNISVGYRQLGNIEKAVEYEQQAQKASK